MFYVNLWYFQYEYPFLTVFINNVFFVLIKYSAVSSNAAYSCPGFFFFLTSFVIYVKISVFAISNVLINESQPCGGRLTGFLLDILCIISVFQVDLIRAQSTEKNTGQKFFHHIFVDQRF